MPRIASRRKTYKERDIGSWIAGKMREKKLTQKDMGDMLGISQVAFGKKIATGHFTYADLLTILDALQSPDDDILRLMKL